MANTRLRFTVVGDVLAGRQFEFAADAPVTIGRTKDNMLVLDHKSVSRQHARVEPNGSTFVLVDLDSHNGTRVGDEVVTRRVLEPGDEVNFGEVAVRFQPVDAAEPTPSEALPAVVPEPTTESVPARPLTVDDLFPGATPTQTMEPPADGRMRGALGYALTLIAVVVLGLLAIWKMSQRPPQTPTVEVQLRAGEVKPVNVARWRRGADSRLARFGLVGVQRVGEPQAPNVAFARKSKFSTIVAVHAKSVGTTDIPLYGPPLGRVILRVLVRGVKPPPEEEAWMLAPLSERLRRADELVDRATHIMPQTGIVNEHTTNAIRMLEQAVSLIGGDPVHRAKANRAAQTASQLRKRRDQFFDIQAQDIATLRTKGDWKNCDAKMQALLRVFKNPYEEEYYIVRAYYEDLLEEMARDKRKREEQR